MITLTNKIFGYSLMREGNREFVEDREGGIKKREQESESGGEHNREREGKLERQRGRWGRRGEIEVRRESRDREW